MPTIPRPEWAQSMKPGDVVAYHGERLVFHGFFCRELDPDTREPIMEWPLLGDRNLLMLGPPDAEGA